MASPAIAEGLSDQAAGGSAGGIPTRKEKRKALKKLKRKQVRREAAILKREAEESRSNDPDEQLRIRLMEEAETEAAERDRRAFEERERHWLEAAAAKKAEEAAATKKFEEDSQRETIPEENELEGGDDWEYVEEGPAEIIWQGNEIIVKKKRVKVPKRNADRKPTKEDDDRPTSNPLPPQSTVFSSYKNCESAQEALEGVAKQIPNFGTEQDKAHCPFHLKTGACRFGSRCSRVHFYPDKSGTLLIKNMYNGPGLAWDQDEGLECTDEEIEHCYEEFYEDVHTEFLKFGELVNFKVCKNGSFHLRGNVYVHYMSLESAVLAYNAMNGRFFAGKQIICEFVGVTKWKVAICGEYMKSRLRTCSHGSACNFIHCFHNPGGDYEWADWDNPPPKYWIKKMNALFGPTVESLYDKQLNLEGCERHRDSSRRSTPMNYRRQSRRCTHDEMDMHRSASGRDDSDGKRDRPRREESSRRRKRSDYLDRYEPNEEKYKFDVHSRDSVEDIPEEQDRYSIKKRQKCEVENHERHVRKHRMEEDSSRWKVGEHGKRHGSSYRVPDDSGAERSDNTREQYGEYCSDGFDHDKNLRENTSEVSEFRSKRRESDKYNSQDRRDDASRDHGRTGKKARSRKSKSTDRLFSSDESSDHQKDADAECNYEETHHHRLVDESSKSGRKGKRHRKKEEFNETEEPSKDLDYDYMELERRETKKHSRSRTPLCRSESSRRERDQQLC